MYDHLDGRLRAALGGTAAAGFDLNVLLRCRDCKESLSTLPSSLFRVYVDGRHFKERVERRTFENLIHDRLEETVRLTQDLVADAARRGQPVDTVVLIGGSARIPRVAARLAEVLPMPPHKFHQQDVAVALGAAWWAGQSVAPVTTKVATPMTVSVAADGRGDYRTLEQALAAVPEGATIHLSADTHRLAAPLLIEKSVRLLGAGMNSTSVVCDGHGYVIKVSGADRFEAQGITFRHEGETNADVVVVIGGELAVTECRFTGGMGKDGGPNGDGMALLGACQGHVSHCQMERNSIGIAVGGQAQPTLEENVCVRNGLGITYFAIFGGVARNNRCVDNDYGIYVTRQAQPTLEDNICEGNKSSGILYGVNASGVARNNRCGGNRHAGILVVGQAQPTLEGNVCERNDVGIAYDENANGVARKNRCVGNQGYGIFVDEQAQPTLEANTCLENRSGDLFENSRTVAVTVTSHKSLLADLWVHIDGKRVVAVSPGQTVTCEVSSGQHTIQLVGKINWPGNRSNTIEFDAKSETPPRFQVIITGFWTSGGFAIQQK